jgi:hypothetical protein
MSKAKVIVKVGDDFFQIGQNIWKMFKGSPDVIRSSATAAKRSNTTVKKGTQQNIKDAQKQTTAQKLNLADQKKLATQRKAAGKKKEDLKKDKKGDEAPVKKETISEVGLGGVRSRTVTPKVKGKGGFILNPLTGKPFTNRAKWLAAGGLGSWATYIAATSGKDKKKTGAASATTTPKPSGPVTTAPAPPSVLSAQAAAATKPKPSIEVKKLYPTMKEGPPQRQPIKAKTLEQRLKAKFIKSHGGIDSFKPTTKVGKAVKGDISAKRAADSSWESELFKMREGSEGSRTYTDQQNYEKIMEERKGTTKKKRGGVIKRNKGGPIRGVGKALRGYGRATYSNKMY